MAEAMTAEGVEPAAPTAAAAVDSKDDDDEIAGGGADADAADAAEAVKYDVQHFRLGISC